MKTQHIEDKHPEGASPPRSGGIGKESDYEPAPPKSSSRTTPKKSAKDRVRSSPASPRPRSKRDPPSNSSSSSSSSRKPKETQTSQSAISAWKEIFTGHKSTSSSSRRVRHKTKHPDVSKLSQPEESARSSTSSRLGKSELGRHVNEKQMPGWLATLLEKEKGVCNEGIVPVLEQLLEKCPETREAWLCSPCVEHISKLSREGECAASLFDLTLTGGRKLLWISQHTDAAVVPHQQWS